MSATFQPGDIISRYRIVGPLGKGGMGVVYAAEDLRLGRKVALKFLPEDRLDETARKRFLNEARAAAQVRHPHICPIYDVDEVDGRIFMAMAHIEGETLSKRIKRGIVPLSDALRWGTEILSGLESAHAAGIVHRDIKSSNIMVDQQGRVLILDFGLALMEDEERLTIAGQAVGTMAYMSPEQARSAPIDSRTDLYSTGVVLYELISGRLPGLTPPPLSGSRPDVSLPVEEVIFKALAERLPERWQNATEMRLALQRLSAGSFADSGTKTSFVAAPATPSIPPWRKWWPAAALALIGIAATSWVISQRRTQPIPIVDSASSVRRIAILPLQAQGDQAQAISDGLLEVWAGAIADAERGGQKIWVVPLQEVRSRKLESAEEARRSLGVDQVVSGSAQPEGSGIRLLLRLTDTASLKTVAEQSILYQPAQAASSREQTLDQVRTLLTMKPEKFSATRQSGRGFSGAYLEGRGFLARLDKSGNIDRAIKRFEEAAQQDPNSALVFISLGEAYWLKSKLANGSPEFAAKAIDYARKGVQLDDTLAIGHAKLGSILAESGKQEEGLRQIERALELSPGNAEGFRELAAIYNKQGKFSEAETLFKNAISARPTDWISYFRLGNFYDAQGRLDDAASQFLQAAKYAPENAGIMRALGRIFRMKGKYPEAIEQFQRASRIQPSARTYNSQGLTFYYMHRYRDAINSIEAAIALDEHDHLLWGNLASACAMSPDDSEKTVPALRKAIELAEKALTVTPDDYSILADLGEFRARLGDKRGALADIKRIPASAQGQLASRIVLAYELSGERRLALETVRTHFRTKTRLRELLDEPAIPALLADPEFQRIVAPYSKQE